MMFSIAKLYLRTAIGFLMKIINWIGYISLTGMVLTTAVNVFGRYILKKPLLGEVDLVQLGMALFGGVAMLIAANKRHHVGVDILLVRLSRPNRILLQRFSSLLGFLTLSVLTAGVFLNGLDTLKYGSTTDTLRVPQGPFEIVFSAFIFLFCLTSLVQAFRPEELEVKGEGGPQHES
ncbi:MAG: TRAP transporter small permease [Thermodesulfobacteriota bacterium]